MRETELRFQVPRARRAVLDAAVGGRLPRRRVRLRAAYVDTPDRALAKAGLALRVRREAKSWVQTLKGLTEGGFTRTEHNVIVGAAPAAPLVNPGLHAGSSAGKAMATALAGSRQALLGVVCRTDILRRNRLVRVANGVVELAFDVGRITAGVRHRDVCELELELKRGAPQAVVDLARRWVARHGLRLDLRSKAERGDLLARGETQFAPQLASRVELRRGASRDEALMAVLRSCTDQITANASQIASGDHSSEHVHQLRIGLRRLRTALRLFGAVPDGQALGRAAAEWFERLGAARDEAVAQGTLGSELRAAWQQAGLPPASAVTMPSAPIAQPVDVVCGAPAQRLMLDLLGLGLAGTAEHVASAGAAAGKHIEARPFFAARFARWHHKVIADAGSFAELDELARHRLRKRVKRLRYAVEFGESLFEARRVQRYLKRLRALQEQLGRLTDAAMAMQRFRGALEAGAADAHTGFAIGWLQGRHTLLLAEARPALEAFMRTPAFWA